MEETLVLDVAIVGGGPAALSAAIYTTRAGKATMVFERAKVGGLVAETNRVENYPGFIGSGIDLSKQFKTQAEASGAKIAYGDCKKLSANPEGSYDLLIDDAVVKARTVIIASGNEPRPLGIPGEETANISRCATCDATLFNGQIVAVIGGGDAAIQESLHLANIVAKVIVLSRSDFRASPMLLERAKNDYYNIELHDNTAVKQVGRLNAESQILNITHPDGRSEYLQVQGIFAYAGYIPASKFLAGSGVELDPDGYIITQPSTHATNLPGVFAAGDVEAGSTKQIVSAAAAGAEAAMAVIELLDGSKTPSAQGSETFQNPSE